MSQNSSFTTQISIANKFVLATVFLLVSLFIFQFAKAQFLPEDYLPEPTPVVTEEAPTSNESASTPTINLSNLYTANNWHADVPVSINWELTDDIDAVAVALTTSSSLEPRYESRFVYTPAISEFHVDSAELENGTQYLNLQFLSDGVWGDLVSLPINVDFTPPEPFLVQIVNGNRQQNYEPLLRFQTVDKHSGLYGYRVEIYQDNSEDEIIVADGEFDEADGVKGILLSGLESRKPHIVRVYAIDNVGNETISEAYLVVPGFRDLYQDFLKVFNPYNVLIYGLLLLVLLEFLYLHRQRRFYIAREKKLKKETKEINTQLIRVFDALREDVSEQVTLMKKSTRMPKKQIIENLTQSLEVSEMIIDKEVADVETILAEKPKR